MTSSISFDRAVDFYDKTRGLPPDQSAQVTEMLVGELSGRARALEIGVGTGRIGLPLHGRGIELVGIDISLPMLARLVANASGRQPFPVLVADATHLPFRNGGYDAVVASHVFHLIPQWRLAVDEALRVVAPGGVLLVDFGRHGGGPWGQQMEEVFREHGVVRRPTGVVDADEFAAYVGERARVRQLPMVPVPIRASLGEIVDAIERQVMSWTWSYTPEQMRIACAAARERAHAEGVDLDERLELPYDLQFWAYDVPA